MMINFAATSDFSLATGLRCPDKGTRCKGLRLILKAELEKRDKRILQAFEGGAMTVEELRARRADIRAQLKRIQSQDPSSVVNDDHLLQEARIIVKSALRFHEITDSREQKSVLQKVFSKVMVRDNFIQSFEFQPGILPAGSPLLGQHVLLEQPILIFSPPEVLPAEQKRCSQCKLVKKSCSDFYPNKNQCKPCVAAISKMRYSRRRQNG